MNAFLGFLSTLVIIFIVPVIIYGIFSKLLGIQEPEKKGVFFIGVLIEKIGTTIGLVGIFTIAKDFFLEHWLSYALLWFLMFAITEIGQIFLKQSTKKEAVAGVISEAVYFPLAVFVLTLLIR